MFPRQERHTKGIRADQVNADSSKVMQSASSCKSVLGSNWDIFFSLSTLIKQVPACKPLLYRICLTLNKL